MKDIRIVKRDGTIRNNDPDKIHEFLDLQCEGIEGVYISEIELNAELFFEDMMTTKQINQALLMSAENLISVDSPNYAFVAGRIMMSDIRKDVYGDIEPDSLYDIIKRNILYGRYTPELLEFYTKAEIDEIDDHLNHERDMNIQIAGAKEFKMKYLVQDRTTGQLFESPQVMYACIAMIAFINDNQKNKRVEFIKEYYDYCSTGMWNLPTPWLGGMRTPTKQFASCVLVDVKDSIDSIAAAEYVGKKYATLKSGLGFNTGRLRAKDQPIRGGEAINTGPLYHSQSIEISTLSCSQGGIRKGSANFNWVGWHLDFIEQIQYKNGAKPEAESMQHSDHTFSLNGYLYHRLQAGLGIYCFSPEEVPALLIAFYQGNNKKFAELYQAAVDNPNIKKHFIPSLQYISDLVNQRQGTSRVYIQNIDHCNTHGPFIPELAPVSMTNLCVEITQHTDPVEFVTKEDGSMDMNGLVALCNLGAINWGMIKDPTEMRKVLRLGLRALDNVLSYQNYPFAAAKRHNDMYRPVGIGLMGLAHFLAQRGLRYDAHAFDIVDEYAEAMSFYLIEASVDLAEERGACEGFKNTKWSQGITPNQTYAKGLDEILVHKERMPWQPLRDRMQVVGIRNATHMAGMPGETSSKTAGPGTTESFNPVRGLVVTKGGKTTKAKFVVPQSQELANQYDLVWSWTSPIGYLKLCCVLQKHFDQALSVNTYYNRYNHPGAVISGELVWNNILLTYKYGGKTLYYNNNFDDTDFETAVEAEPECESCKL